MHWNPHRRLEVRAAPSPLSRSSSDGRRQSADTEIDCEIGNSQSQAAEPNLTHDEHSSNSQAICNAGSESNWIYAPATIYELYGTASRSNANLAPCDTSHELHPPPPERSSSLSLHQNFTTTPPMSPSKNESSAPSLYEFSECDAWFHNSHIRPYASTRSETSVASSLPFKDVAHMQRSETSEPGRSDDHTGSRIPQQTVAEPATPPRSIRVSKSASFLSQHHNGKQQRKALKSTIFRSLSKKSAVTDLESKPANDIHPTTDTPTHSSNHDTASSSDNTENTTCSNMNEIHLNESCVYRAEGNINLDLYTLDRSIGILQVVNPHESQSEDQSKHLPFAYDTYAMVCNTSCIQSQEKVSAPATSTSMSTSTIYHQHVALGHHSCQGNPIGYSATATNILESRLNMFDYTDWKSSAAVAAVAAVAGDEAILQSSQDDSRMMADAVTASPIAWNGYHDGGTYMASGSHYEGNKTGILPVNISGAVTSDNISNEPSNTVSSPKCEISHSKEKGEKTNVRKGWKKWMSFWSKKTKQE